MGLFFEVWRRKDEGNRDNVIRPLIARTRSTDIFDSNQATTLLRGPPGDYRACIGDLNTWNFLQLDSMSADLLAEFGQGSSSAQSSGSQPQTTRPQADTLIFSLDQPGNNLSHTTSHSSREPNQPSQPSVPSKNFTSLPPRQQPFDFKAYDLPIQNDSHVLFDAAIETPASDDEDEWGEFEGPESTALQSPSQPKPVMSQPTTSKPQPQPSPQAVGTTNSLDLLSLADPVPASAQSKEGDQGSKQQSIYQPPQPTWDDNDDAFGDWGEFTDGYPTPAVPSKPTAKARKAAELHPSQAWEDNTFEDWGDFTDGPNTTPAPPKPKPTPKLKDNSAEPSTSTPNPPTRNFTSTTPTSPSNVRPTNIPPPSVLLDHLTTLLPTLQKEAATAKRHTQPSPDLANKIHNTLQTASHIIAGRSYRWKRDSILSQSMRIGPARSGGKAGGMKLSSVNKHEDVKEEQDAVDVLGLWRERAALFNSLFTAAGLRPILVPPVADGGVLKVVAAKPEQGALKADHPCALCALRREERVLRVDEDVQDSFGEWWTEHWGHTGCRVFWEGNKGLLGQR